MSSLIPMAAGMGQQDAQNQGINYGGISIPGGMNVADYLKHADPLGNKITSIGGDPLNLYGNKNNPNALLFPSQNPNATNNGRPSVLPTLPGIGAPKTYSANSFGGYANLGAGPFNTMASQSAGKLYIPTLSHPAATSGKGAMPSGASGKGGSPYAQYAALIAPTNSTIKQAK